MPGHNKGFCFMVLPRDTFSPSLCYLVIGSLEDAEVQPETSVTRFNCVAHVQTHHYAFLQTHISWGGNKAYVLLNLLRLVHFLF